MPIVPVFDPDTGASGGPAAGGGGGGGAMEWVELGRTDMTGLDAASYTAVGVYTANKGGVPFVDFQISRTGSTGFTCTVDADGILIDGPTSTQGTIQLGISDTETVSRTGAGVLTLADWNEPVALQMQVDAITTSGVAGNGCIYGIASNRNLPTTSGTMHGARLDNDGTFMDLDARVYRGGASDQTWEANYLDATTGPWSGLLTVIIHYGQIAELWFNEGNTAFVEPRTEATGPALAGGSVPTGVYIPAYSTAGIGLAVVKTSSGTATVRIKGWRWLRWQEVTP
jgi:hypothetical protein